MIRLGILAVVLIVAFVVIRHLVKRYVRPVQHRRAQQRLELENRELDEQIRRIRTPPTSSPHERI